MRNEFFFKFWIFFSDFPSSGDGFTLGTISEFYAPPLWLFSDSRALVRKRLYLDVFTCVLLQQFQSFQLSFRPPVDSESILGQSEAPVFSFLLAHMEIHFFRTTCWTDWFPRGFFFFLIPCWRWCGCSGVGWFLQPIFYFTGLHVCSCPSTKQLLGGKEKKKLTIREWEGKKNKE